MTTVRDIALTAGFLMTGVHDFCLLGAVPNDAPIHPSCLLALKEQDSLGLHAEVTQYAPLVARLANDLYAVLECEFAGVWDVEVSATLGSAIAGWIENHNGQAPTADWVKAQLVTLAADFITRTESQYWPILRRSLLAVSHTLSPEVLSLPC